jgi:chromate transporter
MPTTKEQKRRVSLREIVQTFLLIGTIGFGGGMAVIAIIQQTCVDKKNWILQDEFAHGVAFGQILGSFAVNVATFVGFRLRGLKGAIAAALAFITPSVVMIIILSALYFRYNHVPAIKSALDGISPVIVALILQAGYQMAKGKPLSVEPVVIGIISFCLFYFLHLQIILILGLVVLYSYILIRINARGKHAEA